MTSRYGNTVPGGIVQQITHSTDISLSETKYGS